MLGKGKEKDYLIDVKKIQKILPGLETYKEPKPSVASAYMKEINPIKYGNSLILLVIYLFCLISNFWILSERQDASTVYKLTK